MTAQFTYHQILSAKEIAQAKQKYNSQKQTSSKRNIDWLFTFDTWIQLWVDSGHWADRGKTKGKYCMSRFADQGPYSADNVFIQQASANVKDAGAWNKGVTYKAPNISKALKEYAAKVGAEHFRAMNANRKNKARSPETKLKMAAARKAYWAKRRAQSNLDTQA